jgi:8-amino-7-oxononanoate synthase
VDFNTRIQSALAHLREHDLLRQPRPVLGAQGPELVIGHRRVVGLCSNNYLGLANHPRIVDATTSALKSLGIGAGASRHISGTSTAHKHTEQRLASFVGSPACLLFSSGYAANLGAIQALLGPGDVVFSDQLNHASLIDGCRLSRARVLVYRHLDLDHLTALLAEHRSRFENALVVTESVFSMDGDLASLAPLRKLCDQYECGLLVDEAHALGLLGPQGRGLCARDAVRPDLLIGTLGKAFGCSGAFVAGSFDTVQLVENRARSYVFSTAPPPALAAAAAVAIGLVEAADDLRTRVLGHATRLRAVLQRFGYRVPPGETPIIPVLIGPADSTMNLSAAILALGVFIHGVRPPTVPPGTSRLRITPMATHTDEHIDQALAALETCRYLL